MIAAMPHDTSASMLAESIVRVLGPRTFAQTNAHPELTAALAAAGVVGASGGEPADVAICDPEQPERVPAARRIVLLLEPAGGDEASAVRRFADGWIPDVEQTDALDTAAIVMRPASAADARVLSEAYLRER